MFLGELQGAPGELLGVRGCSWCSWQKSHPGHHQAPLRGGWSASLTLDPEISPGASPGATSWGLVCLSYIRSRNLTRGITRRHFVGSWSASLTLDPEISPGASPGATSWGLVCLSYIRSRNLTRGIARRHFVGAGLPLLH